AAIARLEQRLEHARSQEQQLARDLESTRRELTELDRLGETDDQRLADLDERLETLGPEQEEIAESLAELEAALEEAEQAYQDAQQRWEQFSEADRQAGHEAERSQDRVRHLERSLESLAADIQRRRQQLGELPDQQELRERREELGEQLAEIDLQLESLEARRETLQSGREQARETIRRLEAAREQERQRRSRLQGELASLEALVRASLSDSDSDIEALLERHGLASAPRLAERIRVAQGWEDATSWVLAPWLNARLLADSAREALAERLESGELAFLGLESEGEAPVHSLAANVSGAGAASTLLAAIHCADSHEAAWQLRERLGPGESVLTADGLWLGRDWARRRGQGDSADSVL
ncbi:chromosome segregation protein SMC, partial [Halomonas sp. BBD48]|nr:chromosome segregation protein SMC [Halomonas sp. BBD48]